MDTEFQDWEVLDNSSLDSATVNSVDDMQVPEGTGDESDGANRFNYVSLQTHTNNSYLNTTVTEILDEGLDDSDTPTSFDPLSETHLNDSRELLSDESGDCKFSELDCKNEFSFSEDDESQLVPDVIEGILAEPESDSKFIYGSSGSELNSSKIGDLGDATEMAKFGMEIENSSDEKIEGEGKLLNQDEIGMNDEGSNRGGEVGKTRMVWWKLPLDLLKYCAIRVSPVWTVSVAAAVLGFVILGRRLHKMKKKSRSLRLNLAVDDKQKALQLMSKAARLNESFSIVRRVPVIRESHPASGVTVWPVMNLR